MHARRLPPALSTHAGSFAPEEARPPARFALLRADRRADFLAAAPRLSDAARNYARGKRVWGSAERDRLVYAVDRFGQSVVSGIWVRRILVDLADSGRGESPNLND